VDEAENNHLGLKEHAAHAIKIGIASSVYRGSEFSIVLNSAHRSTRYTTASATQGTRPRAMPTSASPTNATFMSARTVSSANSRGDD
jgi:hypothetical protein